MDYTEHQLRDLVDAMPPGLKAEADQMTALTKERAVKLLAVMAAGLEVGEEFTAVKTMTDFLGSLSPAEHQAITVFYAQIVLGAYLKDRDAQND